MARTGNPNLPHKSEVHRAQRALKRAVIDRLSGGIKDHELPEDAADMHEVTRALLYSVMLDDPDGKLKARASDRVSAAKLLAHIEGIGQFGQKHKSTTTLEMVKSVREGLEAMKLERSLSADEAKSDGRADPVDDAKTINPTPEGDPEAPAEKG